MALNKYDRFVKNDFMYDVAQVLRRENKHLERKLTGTIDNRFYENHNTGITSYAVTERIYQYLIFRSLCDNYRMILEDFSYPNKASRMDITIFKARPKKGQEIGEIGIEIKLAEMNAKGVFSTSSISTFKSDFKKIRKAKHENKYILQIVQTGNHKVINEEAIEKQILVTLGRQGTRTHRPELIYSYKFKTEKAGEEKAYILLLLWKVAEQV